VTVPYHTKGSVFTVIEPAEHDKRRRVWDRAFTPSAIKSYEPMLQHRLSQLLDALSSRVGTPVDVAEWFGLFSIDFMGDFAFGGMFDSMTQGGDVQGIHEGTDVSVWAMEVYGTMPWLRPIVVRLPSSKFNRMLQFGLAVAEQRKKQGSQTRDIFYYLVSVRS
jgi:cytochrome P450